MSSERRPLTRPWRWLARTPSQVECSCRQSKLKHGRFHRTLLFVGQMRSPFVSRLGNIGYFERAALVSFDRQFADVALISLIGSTTNLFPLKVNQVSNTTLRETASQLPIKSPNDRWPLGFIASQLFILRPLDRGDSLILRYAACNCLLNGVTNIRQHLSIMEKLFPALLGVGGKGTMSGHEDIRVEACGRLHGLQPVKAIAIVHE